jgi:hypothetical protein
MPPEHRFLGRLVVPAPIDRIHDAIGDVLGYERSRTDFVIRATGDEAHPEVGRSAADARATPALPVVPHLGHAPR